MHLRRFTVESNSRREIVRYRVLIGFCLLVAVTVLLLVPDTTLAYSYPAGDANGDQIVDIDDVTYLIGYIFSGGPPAVCLPCADVAYSCSVDIDDVIKIIGYVFVPGSEDLEYGCSHEDVQSECLEYQTRDDDSSTVLIQVVENDLKIIHLNAWYQCCLEYKVDFTFDGPNITAVESDTGFECDCICHFNLRSTLYDVDPGEYVVFVIGIYGDTLATGAIVVDPESGLQAISQSECFDTPPIPRDENIVYDYSDQTLKMTHYDAYFNCGAGIFVDFQTAGDTLRFYEIAYFDIAAAYCMCYFVISTDVSGIQPGAYVAEIYEKQYPWDSTNLVDTRVLELVD